jgi:hypothetical protein
MRISLKATSLALMIGGTLLVTSCAGGPKPSLDQIQPICTALMGPIKYNTYVKTSQRYAGPQLAPDLHARNQVGQWLGCPAYR